MRIHVWGNYNTDIMKTHVVIDNGKTEIVLTPENDFEKDVIEKVYDSKKDFDLRISADKETNFGVSRNHRFILNLEIKKVVNKPIAKSYENIRRSGNIFHLPINHELYVNGGIAIFEGDKEVSKGIVTAVDPFERTKVTAVSYDVKGFKKIKKEGLKVLMLSTKENYN